MGWNLPAITMLLEWLHNYFGITVKSRKHDEKFGFFEFWLWSRNNVEMIATLRYYPVNFTPKNTMTSFISHKKKKNPSVIPKWSFSDFVTETEALSGIENVYFSNLTYSYSVLGWNLPGITMPLESLHNYYGITVHNRKNDEKIGFFEFWLWFRNNVGIIATLW